MRCILLVIDSFGIGAAPDAADYGDSGSNTAGHICDLVAGEKWPILKSMGLGNAAELAGHVLNGCSAVASPYADYGIMRELSAGKDTTTGHWELAGLVLRRPFTAFPPEYPSFPEDLLARFTSETGRGILGNYAASGTQIIEDLGLDHMRTGYPIVYTSSDSVFQIAAHEDVIPIGELYAICRSARVICDRFNIGRVIARPFTGKPGSFIRTERRKDFSIAVPCGTLLERLRGEGKRTVGIGKIGDIFNHQGLDEDYPDKGNRTCMRRLKQLMVERPGEDLFIFVNLVDTDMVYGHRRDVQGYFREITAIDGELTELKRTMSTDDLMIITADHGCDPAFKGSDHTREYVPILKFPAPQGSGVSLGLLDGFHSAAKICAGAFGIDFWESVIERP